MIIIIFKLKLPMNKPPQIRLLVHPLDNTRGHRLQGRREGFSFHLIIQERVPGLFFSFFSFIFS